MNSFPAGWTDNTVHTNVLNIIGTLAQEFNIDSSRIHVTGNSMGGAGTVFFMQNGANIFASGAPVCAWFEGGNPNTITNAMDKPMWFFHGASDATAALSNSTSLVSKLREAGHQVNLSVYKGVDHFSWNNAYVDPDYPRWVHKKSLGWKWPIKDGESYRFVNVKSGKCLAVENGSAENSAAIVQMTEAANDEAQQWILRDQKNGFYQLINLKSGKALVYGNAKLSQAASGSGDEQRFLMWEIGDRFKVVPKASHTTYDNNAITITDGAMTDNAPASVAQYAGTDHQRFVLKPVTTTVALIRRPSGHLKEGVADRGVIRLGQESVLRTSLQASVRIFDLSGREIPQGL
jgi:hypothetical protein